MRQSEPGQRAALKTTLLLGVAGAAAAASGAAYADTPTAAPADQDKWLPYADIGGGFGSGMTAGKIDVFVPAWQDLDSLVFLNLGVGTETRANQFENFSLGFRTKVDPEWILGVYAGYDYTQLQDNNSFGQAALGAELMSADWDVRLNGYIADNQRKTMPGHYELYIHNTEIAVLQGEDVGYSGFDGEVGYRLFSTDTTDFRLFVGGFYFTHDNSDQTSLGQNFDFSYREMAGPQARAELTMYDLDLLGAQSRLTVTAEVAHDDVRGTTGYGGVALRIPLGDFTGSSGAQALDELDRRMVDPERRRDEVLTSWQYTKPEPVIIYGPHMTSQPTNTLYYVDNTLGAGSYANPTTLHDATTRASTNAFIVITSKQGNVSTSLSGDGVMQTGQSIVGGGETFTVEGAASHAKFSHDFAPGTVNPTITTTLGDNVITLASDTNLYDFSIKGDFDHAVTGRNVTGIDIFGLAIDGTGGGQYGIDISRTVSGNESIYIGDTSVSHVRYEGIGISHYIHDGGTSTETITLKDDTVSHITYGDGIFVDTFASNGTKITSNVTIANPTVSDVYFDGIAVESGAYGAGSRIHQTVTISNATVSHIGYFGVLVENYAGGGAKVYQTASVTDSTIGHIGYYGYTGYGLAFYAHAIGPGAVAAQYITVTDASISDVYGGVDAVGLGFRANAADSGAAIQVATIDPTSVTNSLLGLGIEGIATDSYFATAPTTVYQNISVTGGTFSDDFIGVIMSGAAASDTGGYTSMAATTQKLSLTNVTVDHNFSGVVVYAVADNGASAEQDVSLSGVQINHNAIIGAAFSAYAASAGSATQNIVFNGSNTSYNQIDYNGTGLFIRTDALSGGQVLQHAYVYYTHIVANTSDGVRVRNYAAGYLLTGYGPLYSHVQQNLTFANGSVAFNHGNGIYITNQVNYAAQLDQVVVLYDEEVDFNHGDGLKINSTVTTYQGFGATVPTNLHSDIYIYSSNFSDNDGDGIAISSTMFSPQYLALNGGYSYLEQHITIENSDASNNLGNGLVVSAYDRGVYGLNIQYVTLADSDFGYNGRNGAEFLAKQKYGPGSFGAAVQDVTISDSGFYGNTGNGLYGFAGAYSRQGRAEQHFTVTYSFFGYNGGDGIQLKRFAENGTYVAGLPCTTVQGLAGGCAFVRQTFYLGSSEVYSNSGDGIYIYGRAANLGAIYSESGRPKYTPTFEIKDSSVSYNGADGLFSNTVAGNDSFSYNYIVAIDSQFNGNSHDGFGTHTYATTGSTIVERNVFVYLGTQPLSASYNGHDGVHIVDTAANGGTVDSSNYFISLAPGYFRAMNNSVDGVKIVAGYADALSTIHQYNYFKGAEIAFNGRNGMSFYANGPGAGAFLGTGQYNVIKNSLIGFNGNYGIYGLAEHSGYQLFNYQTYGNFIINANSFNTATGGSYIVE